jgi:hypothetical protein
MPLIEFRVKAIKDCDLMSLNIAGVVPLWQKVAETFRGRKSI